MERILFPAPRIAVSRDLPALKQPPAPTASRCSARFRLTSAGATARFPLNVGKWLLKMDQSMFFVKAPSPSVLLSKKRFMTNAPIAEEG